MRLEDIQKELKKRLVQLSKIIARGKAMNDEKKEYSELLKLMKPKR